MDPSEMAETVMNPETRTLKLVTMDDAETASVMFNNLMGDDISKRKDFIEENAWKANIDI